MSLSGVVRVCVVGDKGAGKTSLIIAASTDSFPEEPPPVLPPTKLPGDLLPDQNTQQQLHTAQGPCHVLVSDTSSEAEWRERLEVELQKSDVVVVCYPAGSVRSLSRVGTYWLPELRHMQVDKPIILVGCKEDQSTAQAEQTEHESNTGQSDVDDHQQAGSDGLGYDNGDNKKDSDMAALQLEQQLANLIDQWKEVEVCLQCSSRKLSNVIEVFSHAQKAVLHPTGPLYDAATGQLKPACVRALKRIFLLCDLDQDGYLSNKELNQFQTTCFNTPLQPEELEGVKKVVQMKIPDGIHSNGITLKGFVYLHALFVARGRMDTTWTVLRKFGYDNSLHLREDLIGGHLSLIIQQIAPDQVVELSRKGEQFFRSVFHTFDKDQDGVLSPQELEECFSTSPSSPWQRETLASVVETSSSNSASSSSSDGSGLTTRGFLSMWDLTTMQSPKVTLMYMLYLGFKGDLSQQIQVSRRRKHEIKRWGGQLERNVLNCFVFATKKTATRVVLDALIGRPKQRAINNNSAAAAAFGNISKTNLIGSSSNSGSASSPSVGNLTCSRVELNLSTGKKDKAGGGHTKGQSTEKTLVMHQYTLEDVESLLLHKEDGDSHGVMASCDLALFAYNGASNQSFQEALGILKQVEQSGPGYMPCVLVATSDLVDESVTGESLSACQSLKMVKPLHIPPLPSATTQTAMEAVRERNRNIFSDLAQVALQPSQSIPQTEERIAQQQYQLMLRRITTGLVIGTGVFSVGLFAMKMWYSSADANANNNSDATTTAGESTEPTL
jgi:Ras family protein T1